MTRRNHRAGRDRALGMDAPITRGDFLNGASIAVGGSIAGRLLPKVTDWVGSGASAAGRNGLLPASAYWAVGGVSSFEAAYRLRDGDLWSRLQCGTFQIDSPRPYSAVRTVS